MHEPSTVTLPILAALVNMSTKYDARTVVKEIVERLKPFYPDTLENFDALKGPKSKMAAVTLFTESTRHDDFRLLALARKCEAPILLPTLFFSCAKHPLPEILAASGIVAQNDLDTIIVGREIMMKDAYQLATVPTLMRPCRGEECDNQDCLSERIDAVEEELLEFGSYDHPTFPLLLHPDSYLNSSNTMGVCKQCLELHPKERRRFRKRAWEQLPYTFSLGNWDGLRRQMGSA